MSNEKAFVWAQSEGALIAKPDQDLLATGWVKGSIPAAANFNWLFKTVTEELGSLRKDIFTIKEDLNRLRDDAMNGLNASRTDIKILKEQTAKDLESLKTSTSSEFSNVRKEAATSNDGIRGELSTVKNELSVLSDSATTRFNSLTQNVAKEFSAVKLAMDAAAEHTEHEIATALEKTDATFSEVRLEAAQTREMAIRARRQTTGHNEALEQLGFVGRRICRQLREMETDLKKLVPGYPPREWPREEDLSAVPHEEESSDGE